jgi:DNA-3-methyladenine glycosylase II
MPGKRRLGLPQSCDGGSRTILRSGLNSGGAIFGNSTRDLRRGDRSCRKHDAAPSRLSTVRAIPRTTTLSHFRNICRREHTSEPRARQSRRIGRGGRLDDGMPHNSTPRPLIVRPVPPFRLDLTVWALRRRARNAIDRWDHGTYRRIIVLGGRVTALSVRQSGSPDTPRLFVTSSPSPRTPAERRQLRMLIERLLGTGLDLGDWYRIARQDRRLGILADRFRGLKPPRFPTVFEALVNAFACQQLSLEVGLELLNRLAVACAVRSKARSDDHFGFPEATNVVKLPPPRYQAIGFSRQKVAALLALARAVDRDELDLEALSNNIDVDACERLLELRGIGRWTAEYVLLRGLGRLHVFPGDDVGAQKRLARWLGRPHALDYEGVRRAVAKWQPYAGLVYFHLLLNGLMQTGALSDSHGTDRRDRVGKEPVQSNPAKSGTRVGVSH